MSEVPIVIAPLYRGDDWSATLTFVTNGESEDVSGSTFTGNLMDSDGRAGNVIGALSFDMTSAASGSIEVSIGNVITDTLALELYYSDVQEEKASGIIQTRVEYQHPVRQDKTA